MKSVTLNKVNDEDLAKSSSRNKPYLTIITTPKKTWRKLFNSTKQSLSSLSHTSSTPSYGSTNSSMDTFLAAGKLDRSNSGTTASTHSSSSLQASLKKFHLPQLPVLSSNKMWDDDIYTPVAPEPVMPKLVDWSPEEPISPPPWEQDNLDQNHKFLKRHSFTDDMGYHSDYDLESTDTQSSQRTLVEETQHRRRTSCPDIRGLSRHSSMSSSTLIENDDIISITDEHTRYVSLLKVNQPKEPALKSCQKVKAKALEAAAQGETIHFTNPIFSTLCEENLKYLYIPNVFDPETHMPIVKFASIKPRKYLLRRKFNWKREAKALMNWRYSLENLLSQPPSVQSLTYRLPPEKMSKNDFTRRFIVREFFMTEVNFWNQLYFSKTIYYDALEYAFKNKPEIARVGDSDVFANLFDLMQFSAKLINRLRHVRFGSDNEDIPTCAAANGVKIDCSRVHIGSILLDMAEDLVVFLRCAIDYKENKKTIDANERRGYYALYQKKLCSKSELNQFTIMDYLIIPIQRVARYGLLIADLIRHTTPDHPDYKNLIRAHQVVTSLATAMNLVQKKPKA